MNAVALIKRRSRPFLSLTCVAVVGLALTAGTAAAASPVDQARVIDLVNQQRADHGLRPNAWNDVLGDAAERYAADMAEGDFFSHRGLDGSRFSERIEDAGYDGWAWLGENLAAGHTTPERVVAAWMNSPGHRAVILSVDSAECGVGHGYSASSRYRNYWTLECGVKA